MVNAAESANAAGLIQDQKDEEAKLRSSQPKLSLLHHMVATRAADRGFTVLLLDGSSYGADRGDFMFTDGLSIVNNERRIYIPLTAVKAIIIKNPGDA